MIEESTDPIRVEESGYSNCSQEGDWFMLLREKLQIV